MMLRSFKIFGLFIMLGAALYSCRKIDEYPIVPSITFSEFEQYGYVTSSGIKIDTALYMSIDFTDGDGDIGYSDGEHLVESDPYYLNLVVKNYIYKNGTYIERKLPVALGARIPNLTPDGIHKSIKGTIRQELYMKNDTVSFDTLRFEVFIYDRALHKSNIITTPSIIVNKQNK